MDGATASAFRLVARWHETILAIVDRGVAVG
jgi:hypothetical protein